MLIELAKCQSEKYARNMGVGGHSAPPCKLFCISGVPNAMRVRSQVLCPNSNRIRSHPMRQKYIVGPDGSATLSEALKKTS